MGTSGSSVTSRPSVEAGATRGCAIYYEYPRRPTIRYVHKVCRADLDREKVGCEIPHNKKIKFDVLIVNLI